MTPIVGAVLLSALVWMLLPMVGVRTTESWRSREYWLVHVLFSLSGIGLILGLIDSSNPAISVLRFSIPVGMGVVLTVINIARGAVVPAAGWFLLLAFVPMTAFALDDRLLMPFMSLAILLPVIFLPRDGYDLRHIQAGMRDSLRTVLFVLILSVIALPGTVIGQCRGDKCSLWGSALGPLGTGNPLGVFLAFVSIFPVLLGKKLSTVLISVLASGVLVDSTSSRSGMLSWAISIGCALLWRCTGGNFRHLLVSASALGVVALTTVMAIYPWRPEEFTGRANLWLVAREKFLESPVFGLGPSYWVRQERTSYVDSNYATHNLLLEILVSGGVFGAVVLVLSVLLLVRSADRNIRAAVLVCLTAWVASSVLEVTAAPGRFYLIPGILVLVFIYGNASLPVGVDNRADARAGVL
ncbi:O-antigen ligase family protein [Pseudarthrobacter sp. NPDC058196]|uniref:O-antigen ligase family protein n=1 Tax=Pseudarthrobacter sp. NPDC058196 TaxID=3346376 RepID=UPI0036D8E222